MSSVDQNRVIVLAVLQMGLTPAEAARRFGVSRQWVYVLLARYQELGGAGLEPRSRRPSHHPGTVSEDLRVRIRTLRTELEAAGLDAGAESIADRLQRQGVNPPAVSTWLADPARRSPGGAATAEAATLLLAPLRSGPTEPDLAV